MSIQHNRLFLLFQQWLVSNVAPDANGDRKVTVSQLWSFLNQHVFADPTTVEVVGAEVSFLWSYRIGPDLAPGDPRWDNNNLMHDLAARSIVPLRFIGNTEAGEFLAFLDGDDGLNYLAFTPGASIDLLPADSDVLLKERQFNQFWHRLSQFFVEHTDGALVTLTPKASITSIYAEDEIPAIVDNDSISQLNGTRREEIGVEIFSDGSMAQIAYLLAVLNGEFAGDLLTTGTAHIVRSQDANGENIWQLYMDSRTSGFLGLPPMPGVASGTDAVTAEVLRADLLPQHIRGLHVALFGPLMREDETEFLNYIGRDYRTSLLEDRSTGEIIELDHQAPATAFIDLQNALAAVIEKIWQAIVNARGPNSTDTSLPEADISTLLKIAEQAIAEGDDAEALERYFTLLAAQVKPHLEDAPEELKRDITDAIEQVLKAGQDALPGVPDEFQQRLAITSGGQLLYLLDQARQDVLYDINSLEALINGVGIYSRSVTQLGDAFHVTLGASSVYAIVRDGIENILDVVTAPSRALAETLIEHFDFFDKTGRTVLGWIDQLIDDGLDIAGNPFRNVAIGTLAFGEGKTAVRSLETTLGISQGIQLLVGQDEAALIGNNNNDAAFHTGYGSVHALGGNDVILAIGWQDQPDDQRLLLDGGEGDDIVVALGGGGLDGLLGLDGKGAITIGGLGRDWIFNTSDGGIIWGDIKDAYKKADGTQWAIVDGEEVRITDSAANSDNIWYAPNVKVMDAQHADVLKFYGFTMTGGDANGGVLGAVGMGLIGAVAGMASYTFSGGDWRKQVYSDHLLPWMTYMFRPDEDGNMDMFITNQFDQLFQAVFGGGQSETVQRYNELARQGILGGWMKIENVDIVGSFTGINQFGLAGLGDFNMVFRAPNSIWAVNDNECARDAREAA